MSNETVNRAFMHKSIPYVNCYEEGGMIEVEKGIFTMDYKIIPPDVPVKGGLFSKKCKAALEDILFKITDNCDYEFVIRNSFMDQKAYLDSIMLDEKKEEKYAAGIHAYNALLKDNYEVGHNNFKSEWHYIPRKKADTPEQALDFFKEREPMLQDLFQSLYGYKIKALTLSERMALLYDIYHSNTEANTFGSKADYDGKGFSIESMERMKLTTKDIVMPDKYDCSQRTYLRVGEQYARTFFVSYIPKKLAENALLDISSVSTQSIISVYGQSLDYELGFQVAAKYVQHNTEVKCIPIRDTINDRKKHRMERKESRIHENEDEYFYQSALDMFKEAMAKEQPVIQSTILITLFADTLEELERDTKLLFMSASKYACQIRCLDLQQNEGFQSMLPLCNMRVNVSRVFSLEQMAAMQPLRIQDIFERNRTYYGMNAINDNLILMDRSNYPIAMIAGNKGSGKSFSVKRSAANTLFSTRDDVIIFTDNTQTYEAYVSRMHGQMIPDFQPEIFSKDENYNLNQDRQHLQKIYMEAYLTYCVGEHYLKGIPDYKKRVEQEAAILSQFTSLEEALLYAKEHPVELPIYIKSLEHISFTSEQISMNQRLAVIGFKGGAELVTKLDAVWNYVVLSKKRNRTVWIYVDAADALVCNSAGNNYLISILERAEILKVPVTLVIEDAVHIAGNQKHLIEFDYLLNRISCFKLLSLGPLERKVFIERLNISQQMVPYFVDRGPGEGILVIPSATIAFCDRYETAEDGFYKLFQ